MTEEHIGPEQLLAMLRAAATGWQEGRAETDALDAALGDGDHGSGLAAGFAVAIVGLTTEATMSEMLLQTATQLMNRMGGAAGALFGSFFLGIATAIRGQSSLSMTQFAAACAAGLASVQRRSHANLGDKTMLDALEPAVRALEASARAGTKLLRKHSRPPPRLRSPAPRPRYRLLPGMAAPNISASDPVDLWTPAHAA